jgi:hypothetical protein
VLQVQPGTTVINISEYENVDEDAVVAIPVLLSSWHAGFVVQTRQLSSGNEPKKERERAVTYQIIFREVSIKRIPSTNVGVLKPFKHEMATVPSQVLRY